MQSVLEAFRTPLNDPVVVIALAMVVFLCGPLLFERLRLPSTVAFIAAGAVLGPNGLGWMARDQTIVLLGTVGLLYLMFIAAVEIDLHDFDRHRSRSGLFGLLGFLIPQVLGIVAGRVLGYSLATSVLLGSMLSSHTLLAYPIASRLGIAKNQAVMVAVGATIITDLLALLVLAVVAAGAQGQLSVAFWARTILSLAAFAVFVFKALPRVADWFFKRVHENGLREYMFVLAVLFASAVAAGLAGIEPIVGAFLAGLALNPLLPEGQPLTNRLNFFSDAFFTPFFLFSVGMLVDVRVLGAGPRALMVLAAMIATVLPAKWIAAWLTRRRFSYSFAEAATMFGLSVPQAAATLAIALVGYRVKLFDTAVLNATIMIILVTSTLGPWLVERYGRRVALDERRRPFRPGTEPQRILIPILEPDQIEGLVDLALLLRSPGTKEPLLPLAVVQQSGRAIAERVARAERLLAQAVMRSTAAGVQAVPLTRVAHDLATGIGRGMAESRATTVIAGWSGRRDKRRSVLNRGLDRMIQDSQQLVMAVSLAGGIKPLNKIEVVLPPAVDRGPGFNDAIHVIKLIANRLTATIRFHIVRSEVDAIRTVIDSLRPAARVEYEDVPNWFAAMRILEHRVDPNTLLVLVSERPHRVAWQRELDRMPRRFASLAANLCVMYPCTAEPAEPHYDHVLTLLAEALQAGRITVGVEDTRPEVALQTLLATEFQPESPRYTEALGAIERTLLETTSEIAPGSTFLFGRMAQLSAPLLFIATSEKGVRFPRVATASRVTVMVLAPSDHRTEPATYLDQLRPLLRNRARLDDLAACSSPTCVGALFRSDDRQPVSAVRAA